MNKNKGFTLIELLVVIAIIGILASVVLASLSNARDKGKDAAVKSQLASMKAQAELYLSKSTDETYDGVCADTQVNSGFGGTTGPGLFSAANASSGTATSINIDNNAVQTNLQSVCNDSALGWAASVPLSAASGTNAIFYCSDSSGLSKETSNPLGAMAVVCS